MKSNSRRRPEDLVPEQTGPRLLSLCQEMLTRDARGMRCQVPHVHIPKPVGAINQAPSLFYTFQ